MLPMAPDSLFNVWCGVKPVVTEWLLQGLATEGLSMESSLEHVLPEPYDSLAPSGEPRSASSSTIRSLCPASVSWRRSYGGRVANASPVND